MQKVLNELNRMLDRAIAQDNHRDYEAPREAIDAAIYGGRE